MIESIHQQNWKQNKGIELNFWKKWIELKGWDWKDDYLKRTDSSILVDPVIADILKNKKGVIKVLDVGAGPLTSFGKKLPWAAKLEIIAIDALAKEFNETLKQCGINPLIKTEYGLAEEIKVMYPNNSFDFIFSRNALDHTYDPMLSLMNMLEVLKKGQYIFLTHQINLGAKQQYSTLAQWNLNGENGEFVIWNEYRRINISRELKEYASIQLIVSNEWIDVLIKKK